MNLLKLQSTQNHNSDSWFGLMIGNSRLHWAKFLQGNLVNTWHTNHFSNSQVRQYINRAQSGTWCPDLLLANTKGVNRSLHIISKYKELPLYLASVVPSKLTAWEQYPTTKKISLEHIPLKGAYSSLGIDRALALWGAGESTGWPTLIIDAGTALTLTAANNQKELAGGAILPGLGLQIKSLQEKTECLPNVELPTNLPSHWAMDTASAIQSGVMNTVISGIWSFIDNWWSKNPESYVILTGGDSNLLYKILLQNKFQLNKKILLCPELIFTGMKFLVK